MKEKSVQVLKNRIRKNPYFVFGVGALVFACSAQIININTSLTDIVPKTEWQIITGTLMLAILAFQWGLFFHKLRKNVSAIPRSLKLHKYMGIGFILLFALHADTIGYAWTMGLTVILLGLLITGLFNREILAYRPQWAYRTWLWLHVALAAILMPLVIFHSLIAMTFE